MLLQGLGVYMQTFEFYAYTCSLLLVMMILIYASFRIRGVIKLSPFLFPNEKNMVVHAVMFSILGGLLVTMTYYQLVTT